MDMTAICNAASRRSKIWYNNRNFHMCMLDEIAAKRGEIYAIVKKHKAERLWVFGSCARREVAA